jgi:tetratricopeptide (TPR) repeat protein
MTTVEIRSCANGPASCFLANANGDFLGNGVFVGVKPMSSTEKVGPDDADLGRREGEINGIIRIGYDERNLDLEDCMRLGRRRADAFDRSLALNPSSALAFGLSSLIRAWNGDGATAVEHTERALRLSPFDPLSFNAYNGTAYAHYFAGQFDEAARAASMATQANPRFIVPWILRAAALAKAGRIDEAKASAQRVLNLQQSFTISSFLAGNFTSEERLAVLGDGLRQAGLPE